MTYKELRDKHEKEVNEFPFVFAFSNEQFYKGISEKWGYTPEDTGKIFNLGAGAFIRKEDAPRLKEMQERHVRELSEALQSAAFFEDALYYELCNHEYVITNDPEEALNALGLTADDIINDPARLAAYRSATARAVKDCE